MLKLFIPTRLKLIVALVVAISSFLSLEIFENTKNLIWNDVSPNLSKEYLMETVPEQGSVSFGTEWHKLEIVSEVEGADIDKALWLERLAQLLIFTFISYLSGCIIVTLSKHEKQI